MPMLFKFSWAKRISSLFREFANSILLTEYSPKFTIENPFPISLNFPFKIKALWRLCRRGPPIRTNRPRKILLDFFAFSCNLMFFKGSDTRRAPQRRGHIICFDPGVYPFTPYIESAPRKYE